MPAGRPHAVRPVVDRKTERRIRAPDGNSSRRRVTADAAVHPTLKAAGIAAAPLFVSTVDAAPVPQMRHSIAAGPERFRRAAPPTTPSGELRANMSVASDPHFWARDGTPGASRETVPARTVGLQTVTQITVPKKTCPSTGANESGYEDLWDRRTRRLPPVPTLRKQVNPTLCSTAARGRPKRTAFDGRCQATRSSQRRRRGSRGPCP